MNFEEFLLNKYTFYANESDKIIGSNNTNYTFTNNSIITKLKL